MCHNLNLLIFATQIILYVRIWLRFVGMCTIYGGGSNVWKFKSSRIGSSLKTSILDILFVLPCNNPPGHKEYFTSIVAFLFLEVLTIIGYLEK